MESPVPTPADPDVPDVTDTPDTPDAPGATAAAGPVWRFLIKPQWIAWHVFVVASIWIMLWLGDWQLHRALAGNSLSWAYTFEWPLFSGFALVFWARTIRDEFRLRRGDDGTMGASNSNAADPVLPEGIGTQQAESPDADASADDTELADYNAYLARLHAEVKGHGKWRGFR